MTVPVATLAQQALRLLGVRVVPLDDSPTLTEMVPVATIATMALVELGVIASDETPIPSDQALALDKVASVHAALDAEGVVWWSGDAVPRAFVEEYVKLAASQASSSFGKSADPAIVAMLEARVRKGAMVLSADDNAVQAVMGVHNDLVGRGIARWTSQDIPDAVKSKSCCVVLAADDLAPLFDVEDRSEGRGAGDDRDLPLRGAAEFRKRRPRQLFLRMISPSKLTVEVGCYGLAGSSRFIGCGEGAEVTASCLRYEFAVFCSPHTLNAKLIAVFHSDVCTVEPLCRGPQVFDAIIKCVAVFVINHVRHWFTADMQPYQPVRFPVAATKSNVQVATIPRVTLGFDPPRDCPRVSVIPTQKRTVIREQFSLPRQPDEVSGRRVVAQQLVKQRARWQGSDSHMILRNRVRWSGRSRSFQRPGRPNSNNTK